MTTDPVRIVPVLPVDEIAAPAHGAAAGPPPELVYNGGALLGAVEVFTATITGPALGSTITDAAIRDTVRRLIADGAVPPVDPNTLYFLYLPPDVAVVQGGGRSCQAFCGYHNTAGDGIYYAVMPYPGCAGCAGELALFDALTSTSSHELCEAVTDPVPGAGWYDDAHGEIGDICAWQTKQLGGYTVQLEWSNRRGACV